MHFVGFVIRIYHDERASECQILGEFQTSFHVVKFFSVLVFIMEFETDLKA